MVINTFLLTPAISIRTPISIPGPQGLTEEQASRWANTTQCGDSYSVDKLELDYNNSHTDDAWWFVCGPHQSGDAELGDRNHVLFVFESPASAEFMYISQR